MTHKYANCHWDLASSVDRAVPTNPAPMDGFHSFSGSALPLVTRKVSMPVYQLVSVSVRPSMNKHAVKPARSHKAEFPNFSDNLDICEYTCVV